jgi:hypothetical protein
VGIFDSFFNRQEIERTVEQLLEGTDVTAGVVIEIAPGQYEVVATAWHEPKSLPADNQVSILDLIDQHRRSK